MRYLLLSALVLVGAAGGGAGIKKDKHIVVPPREETVNHREQTAEIVAPAPLRRLARHQHPDGHWGVTSYVEQCGKHAEFAGRCDPNPGDDQYDTGVTALSLLAFLGAGYYDGSKDVVDGMLRWTLELVSRVKRS